MKKQLSILGIRGIPAQHGGFETFAEKLALYLVKNEWEVTVYCQQDKSHLGGESIWNGIRLVHIPIKDEGSLGTILFDWKSILMAIRTPGIHLTLGYNTAVFNIIQRVCGKQNLINMDGIEWKRGKWGTLAKLWFWLNERAGYYLAHHLIADHPEIKIHLSGSADSDHITMIPYGADAVTSVDSTILSSLGLKEDKFSVIIARPEPENSVLEMVAAFSRSLRNHKLVVLGKYQPESNDYHRKVMQCASCEVIFPGAIYDKNIVEALRYSSRFYLHGHTVGGTNPSLVEALGAGCATIAHNNRFNRWVAGESALYFSNEDDCASVFDKHLADEDLIKQLKKNSSYRYIEAFQWNTILQQYDELLSSYHAKSRERQA